jgi:hypothetical protein
MRKKADEVAKQEKKLARYRIELENRAATAPEDNDPMSAYRSATLVPFTDNNKCGLKRPDGSIAVPATYATGSYYNFYVNNNYGNYKCGMKLWGRSEDGSRVDYGIFVMIKGFKSRTSYNGETYSKVVTKVDLFDDDGKPVVQGISAGELNSLPRFEELGLISFVESLGYDQELALYSLPERRFLIRERSARSIGYITHTQSLVEHEGRAAVIIRQGGGDWRCRDGELYGEKGKYFFLDTEQYGGERCFPTVATPGSSFNRG